MTEIALLGECMLELSPAGQAGQYQLAVAGDTYNTAASLARLGCDTRYLTALGVDRHSEGIRKHMEKLGIGHDWIQYREKLSPGLYLIDNDSSGERFFHYWRSGSAAHQTLSDPVTLTQLLEPAGNCPRLMFSGITLALCGEAGRPALLEWLQGYRADGGQVIYDGNYRAALWPGLDQARLAHERVLEHVDVFLPGVEDEMQLRSPCKREQLLELLAESAVGEIVLKDGPGQVQARDGLEWTRIDTEVVKTVVDTTGAGDSFNGAYLAARIRGCEIVPAIEFACTAAARTIRHRGAILPGDQWQSLAVELENRAR